MNDNFLRRWMKDEATLWRTDGVDSAGDSIFSSPLSIICRWEDSIDNDIGRDGEEFTSKSLIYVELDLLLGDYLFLGTSISSDPLSVIDAFMIKKIEKVSTPTGKKFVRKITL